MKTIKIRFIQHRENKYSMQRKVFFGWRDITYTINMGYGSVTYDYIEETKESLLDKVLEEYYQIDKRFVRVIEHSTIKIY